MSIRTSLGDSKYTVLHAKLRKIFRKPSSCQKCRRQKVSRLEWANVSGIYNDDIKNYLALCPACHRKHDYGIKEGFCINGHRMIDGNSYVRPRGTKECKTCRRIARAKWKDSLKKKFVESLERGS